MRIDPYVLLTAGSMTGNVNSKGVHIQQYGIGSIQAVWTGTPVGTLILQVSDDIVPAPNSPTADPAANVVNWSNYTASAQTVNGAGNFLWNMNFLGYAWVRLSYTAGSSTGSLSATFLGKG